MNTTWLFGQSLKRMKSPLLPIGAGNGLELPIRPSLVCGFDGVDDYISVDNSQNVGSPYDFEYNQPFSFAAKITPAAGIPVNGAQIFRKFASSAGWVLSIDSNYFLFLGIFQPTSSPRTVFTNVAVLAANVTTYVFWVYNGSGNIHTGSTLYFFNTLLVKTITTSANTTPTNSPTITSTMKNTATLKIGSEIPPGSWKGKIEHPSIWNIALTDPQVTDLASRMANDTVEGHALYSSNNAGYFREFLPSKVINAKNPTYNGTYSGFTNP